MAATAVLDLPVSYIDPFASEFHADPYRFHGELRDAGPGIWLSRCGIVAMARHAEVQAALNDHTTFMSGAGAGVQDLRKSKAWRPRSIVLEVDPPVHDETRGALGRVLSGPAICKLRQSFAREAEHLAEALVARSTFDAVSDLAIFLLKVIGDAVGARAGDRECLLPFSNMLFNSFGRVDEILRQSVDSARVVQQLSHQCARASLTSDGFGAAIDRLADQGRITPEQAPALVRCILSAGFDAAVAGLGNAVYAFATNPDQWELLRQDPALQRSAFDEIMRWESPVQTFVRTTARAVQIGGATLAAGEKVLLFLAAANRDPRRVDHPDRLDLRRASMGRIAFGSGIHACIGMTVARLEAELLFAAFARRVARFELAGEPTRRCNKTLRAFASLPVRVVRIQ